MNVIDLDNHRIAPFLIRSIDAFLSDPPDSDYQKGYLAALITVYREGLNRCVPDIRIIAAEKLLRAKNN